MAKSSSGAYGAKQLAADAIGCALIVGFSILFSSLAYLSRSVFGVLIAAMFAFYFNRKPPIRCLTAAAVMSLLVMMLQGVTLAVSVSIPNIVSGIILSAIVAYSAKVYYLVAVPALAGVSAAEYLLVSRLMLDSSVFASLQEALSKYSFIQIPEADAVFYLICYFICFCLVMGAMKAVIVKKLHRILQRHLPKHLRSL